MTYSKISQETLNLRARDLIGHLEAYSNYGFLFARAFVGLFRDYIKSIGSEQTQSNTYFRILYRNYMNIRDSGKFDLARTDWSIRTTAEKSGIDLDKLAAKNRNSRATLQRPMSMSEYCMRIDRQREIRERVLFRPKRKRDGKVGKVNGHNKASGYTEASQKEHEYKEHYVRESLERVKGLFRHLSKIYNEAPSIEGGGKI